MIWTRILGFLAPISKYLTLIACVVSFTAGGYIARTYYVGKIAKADTEYQIQVNKYLNKVMELDNEYQSKIKEINKRLVITKEKLDAEINKPEYSCPIPDDGIKLLNNALGARKQPKDGSK